VIDILTIASRLHDFLLFNQLWQSFDETNDLVSLFDGALGSLAQIYVAELERLRIGQLADSEWLGVLDRSRIAALKLTSVLLEHYEPARTPIIDDQPTHLAQHLRTFLDTVYDRLEAGYQQTKEQLLNAESTV
jgi:hypothetical protein